MRTITLALLGFAGLMVAAPEWARPGLIVFAAIFAAASYALDAEVREALRFRVTRSTRAKRPAGRPAAT